MDFTRLAAKIEDVERLAGKWIDRHVREGRWDLVKEDFDWLHKQLLSRELVAVDE